MRLHITPPKLGFIRGEEEEEEEDLRVIMKRGRRRLFTFPDADAAAEGGV